MFQVHANQVAGTLVSDIFIHFTYMDISRIFYFRFGLKYFDSNFIHIQCSMKYYDKI